MRVCALKEILIDLQTASDFTLDRLGEELNKGRYRGWLETDVEYRERLQTYVMSKLTLAAGTGREDIPSTKALAAAASSITQLQIRLSSIERYDLNVGASEEPSATLFPGVGVVLVKASGLDSEGARVLAARLLRAAERLEEIELRT